MRPAYGAAHCGRSGAKEIRIGEHPVTVVVDVANVMGSRPDGWWRDRAGAAVRLHADLVRLAASGRAVPPGETDPPDFVMVLEGAANAAASRISSAAASTSDAPASDAPASDAPASDAPASDAPASDAPASEAPAGEVRVVRARGSGDDTIVAVVRDLPGRRIVVTADRELRERSVAAGATILGPSWLLGLLQPLAARERPGMSVFGLKSGHPARSTGWPTSPLAPGALGRRSEHRSSHKAALARVSGISTVWKIL
jgi:hypothetical protein